MRFNKKLTWVNMAVSAVGYVCWGVWLYDRFEVESDELHRKLFYTMYIPISLPPLLLSVLLTILFLHLDTLCCCCSSTAVPGEELSVYDPDSDRRFVIRDGQLMKPSESYVETGNTPSSSLRGCFIPFEDQTLAIVF